MYFRRVRRAGVLFMALWLAAQPAAAITIQLDYTYDSSGFFSNGNPQGATGAAQAKKALEAVANFYTIVLTDAFSAITVPPQYHSTAQGSTGVVTWSWEEKFQHPSSANQVTLLNPTVNADQYTIYVGGRALSGSTAGQGGPGGFNRPAPTVSGTNNFTQQDIDTINATTASFDQTITLRGQPSGFANWGGTISFDNDGSTPWFFNHLALPSGNVTDFYSIALHEMAHSLGFGVSAAWQALVSGSTFTGSNAMAQNGGNPVPLSTPDLAHWVAGKTSVVYGTATSQEAVMDPDLLNGTRKKLTELDAAGLKDIGWSPGPAGIPGDYNNNGLVDAADYVVWRKNLGQNVTLPNDITSGNVSSADYTVWRSNFGSLPAAGSGSGVIDGGSAVPEPASGWITVWLGLAAWTARNKRGRSIL